MAVRSLAEANPMQRALRTFGATSLGSWVFSRSLHRLDAVWSRLSPGRPPLSQRLAGLPIGMLTTTGARSGLPRTVPLVVVTVENGWGVIASSFGSATHPAWHTNLMANPSATLELDGANHRVRATLTAGEQRERIRSAALRFYPGYDAYARRAIGREIGVFLLTPDTAPDIATS